MELTSIRISQYANGFVATGYDNKGMSIMDGEPKPNPEDAVNSLLYWLNNDPDEEIGEFRELNYEELTELEHLMNDSGDM